MIKNKRFLDLISIFPSLYLIKKLLSNFVLFFYCLHSFIMYNPAISIVPPFPMTISELESTFYEVPLFESEESFDDMQFPLGNHF